MAEDILVITLVKGISGSFPKHRRTIRALGLRRIRQSVLKKDTPSLRGMLKQVEYLVKWEKK